MTPAAANPFSTTLSLKIMEIIRRRDFHILGIRNSYQKGSITKESFTTSLEEYEGVIADEILDVVTRNFRSLEDTVNKVLALQEQMRVLRDAAAGVIPDKA